MQDATGSWHWTDAVNLGVPLAFAVPLIWAENLDMKISTPTFGLIVLISAVSSWQHRRLKARVEALTKLVSEIGYPGEA